MTFIQPNKNSGLWTKLIAVGALALAAGVFGMIALYNATVNARHNIAETKAELDKVGAQLTELNNRVVTALGGGSSAGAAIREGLVAETRPQYFDPLSSKSKSATWPIASHL